MWCAAASGRDGMIAAALCLKFSIKPLARVASLWVKAILRMCYPLAHGLAAGGYFVLPPRPPPNECLVEPMRGLPPLPFSHRTLGRALFVHCSTSSCLFVFLATALRLPGRWVLAACRRLRSRQLALGCAARGWLRPSLRPLGPSAWLDVANIGLCCDVVQPSQMLPTCFCEFLIYFYIPHVSNTFQYDFLFICILYIFYVPYFQLLS